MIKQDRCPDEQWLTAFNLGDLPETELSGVAAHVESCPSCERRLRELERHEDVALRLLRRPRGAATTVNQRGRVGTADEHPTKDAGWATLPEYEILGRLGEGGMGVVFKARHIRLGRLVALKLIRGDKPNRLARFRAEAAACARLLHPNIVQIFEVGDHQGKPYLALELVEGGTLAERLAGKPQPPRQSAAVVRSLAEAIHYAHQRGVVHRDLKPANVLLSVAGQASWIAPDSKDKPGRLPYEPKVADFGLAKRLDSEGGQTEAGDILGTPEYMAPEQALGETKDVGPAADVYALGAVLYEMLTGRPPFRGTTPLQTMEQVRTWEPVPPRVLQPDVPRDLETICLMCLRKEPARRYADAAALAEDLRRYHDGEPIRARPVGPAERARLWARRNKAIAVALAAGLLFLLTLTTASLVAAEHFRELADENKELAKEQGRLAAEEAARGKELLETLYRAEIHLASQALDTHRGRARGESLLGRWLPSGGRPDLRGWEWFYLKGQSGQMLLTIKAHSGWGRSVCWSPDGKRLASSAYDGTAKVWDAATGRMILVLPHDKSPVSSICWSPDGKKFATGTLHHMIRVWDAATGMELLRLGGHQQGVSTVTWSPGGDRLASASYDKTVRVWDAKGGTQVLPPLSHPGTVWSVAWSPDGRKLASVGDQGAVKVWDAATGRESLSLPGHSERVLAVAWSPDGTRIATGGEDRMTKVWDVASGKETRSLTGQNEIVSAVAWSPGGDRLVTASLQGRVQVWNVEEGFAAQRLPTRASANFAAWSPDGERLAIIDHEGEIEVWDAGRRAGSFALKCDARSVGVSWCPAGTRIASVMQYNAIRLWDVASGTPLLTLPDAFWRTTATWSPDGSRIASAGADHAVKVWSASTGAVLSRLPGHTDMVRSVRWSPDGKRLASASHDGTVRLWDVAGGEAKVIRGHAGEVTSVSWSPSGERLVSVGQDGTVRVWDTGGTELTRSSGHVANLGSVAWSPSGSRLAWAAGDAVLVWDPSGDKPPKELLGHAGPVYELDWSPDGARLASGGMDKTIRVWDPDGGHETIALHGHSNAIGSVAWSPEGARLVSGSWDNSVRVWDATAGYLGEPTGPMRPRFAGRVLRASARRSLLEGKPHLAAEALSQAQTIYERLSLQARGGPVPAAELADFQRERASLLAK